MSPRAWLGLLVLPVVLLAAASLGARAPAPFLKKQPKQFSNSIGMKLVLIPAGKFRMGSPREEKPRGVSEEQHEVEITKAFYLGAFEVTQKQFREVMRYHPSYFSGDGQGSPRVRHQGDVPAGGKEVVRGLATDDFPVENVSWDEAVEFCRKLSALPWEKRAGHVYRLPTEAEWEYACRAGTSTTWCHGETLADKQANFNNHLRRTTRVGSYKANAWGLYDMHGNVAEWCADWYDKDYYRTGPRRDPPGPATGTVRVFRGGSWRCAACNCRAAYRFWFGPGSHDIGIGFRVVLVAPRGG
jgi:formylglycine-generating enzyme required for sulfatase activity